MRGNDASARGQLWDLASRLLLRSSLADPAAVLVHKRGIASLLGPLEAALEHGNTIVTVSPLLRRFPLGNKLTPVRFQIICFCLPLLNQRLLVSSAEATGMFVQ